MAWSLELVELPNLLTAFADSQRVIHPAFSAAVRPFGFFPAPTPVVDQFRPDKAEWRIGWLLNLPDRFSPFETVRCELSLDEWEPLREVCGWIQVDRYVGHGATVDDELWRSADHRVESPFAAAAAIRAVSVELAERLASIDLRPYLSRKHAEPSHAPSDLNQT